MSSDKLLYSLPGEWIDRRGDPRMKGLIRRVIVIKPDHIGDLLIAAKAFQLLRQFFPFTEIDLICGPWNVALAKKLMIFDHIYGVDIFHEISGQQSDAQVARDARGKGVEAISELRLGPYDIALDLRYDPDSRSVLPTVDARIYCGFGSPRQFPFLDIILPFEDGAGEDGAPAELILGSDKFHRRVGTIDVRNFPARGSAVISSQKSEIDLEFIVTGAKSPADCGTAANDLRPLGIALQGIVLSPARNARVLKDSWSSLALTPSDQAVALLSNWASPEDWGVWGIGSRCLARVALPSSRGESEVRVDLELMAHVNSGNPEVQCIVRAAGSNAQATMVCRHPKSSGGASIFVSRHDDIVSLVSTPFELATGVYTGVLRLFLPMEVGPAMSLRLTLLGVDSRAVLMQRVANSTELHRGFCDLLFECRIETINERLCLEIRTDQAPLFEGARVELMTLTCSARQKLHTPTTHMEQRACMLVLRTALEFSTEAPFQGNGIAARLKSPSDSTPSPTDEIIATFVSHIADWKSTGSCVIGIGLGVNSEIRKWPYNYYLEMVRNLLSIGPVRPIFIGGAGDAMEALDACKELGLDPNLHMYCGKVPLRDLGRLMQEFDLFVSNNTGTTHFAGRVGVRTVGIYAGTNHPREWGPVGENVSWIYRDEKCAPCFLSDLRECRFGHMCMKNLLPKDVLAILEPEVRAVLSRREMVST